MQKTLDVSQNDTQLTDLISLARAGTEVLLTEGDRPFARLIPVMDAPPKPRVAGLHPGAAQMSDDFDAPLPEDFWTGAV